MDVAIVGFPYFGDYATLFSETGKAGVLVADPRPAMDSFAVSDVVAYTAGGVWLWDMRVVYHAFPVNEWVSVGTGDLLFAPWVPVGTTVEFVVVGNIPVERARSGTIFALPDGSVLVKPAVNEPLETAVIRFWEPTKSTPPRFYEDNTGQMWPPTSGVVEGDSIALQYLSVASEIADTVFVAASDRSSEILSLVDSYAVMVDTAGDGIDQWPRYITIVASMAPVGSSGVVHPGGDAVVGCWWEHTAPGEVSGIYAGTDVLVSFRGTYTVVEGRTSAVVVSDVVPISNPSMLSGSVVTGPWAFTSGDTYIPPFWTSFVRTMESEFGTTGGGASAPYGGTAIADMSYDSGDDWAYMEAWREAISDDPGGVLGIPTVLSYVSYSTWEGEDESEYGIVMEFTLSIPEGVIYPIPTGEVSLDTPGGTYTSPISIWNADHYEGVTYLYCEWELPTPIPGWDHAQSVPMTYRSSRESAD